MKQEEDDMAAVKSTNSKSSRSIRSTSKKATKTTKGKTGKPDVVLPKFRQQMIAKAAYFKALSRDFQGDYCVEDWLEAEAEVDTLLNGD